MKIVILGCGRVGAHLAALLDANGHQVTVLDNDSYSFRRLPPTFGGNALFGQGLNQSDEGSAGSAESRFHRGIGLDMDRQAMEAEM